MPDGIQLGGRQRVAIAIAAISKRNIREGIVKRHSHDKLHPIESINSIGHATNRKDVRVDTGTCPQQTALLVGDVLEFISGVSSHPIEVMRQAPQLLGHQKEFRHQLSSPALAGLAARRRRRSVSRRNSRPLSGLMRRPLAVFLVASLVSASLKVPWLEEVMAIIEIRIFSGFPRLHPGNFFLVNRMGASA